MRLQCPLWARGTLGYRYLACFDRLQAELPPRAPDGKNNRNDPNKATEAAEAREEPVTIVQSNPKFVKDVCKLCVSKLETLVFMFIYIHSFTSHIFHVQ